MKSQAKILSFNSDYPSAYKEYRRLEASGEHKQAFLVHTYAPKVEYHIHFSKPTLTKQQFIIKYFPL